jgi:ATP-dependent DNA ligase
MIFDILFVKMSPESEEEHLMNRSLAARRKILNQTITEEPGVIELVKSQPVHTFDQLMQVFEERVVQ